MPFGSNKPLNTTSESSHQRDQSTAFVSMTTDESLVALGVDAEKGLSDKEVVNRRLVYGFNEVSRQRQHPVRLFLGKFWGLSAWMLELIILLSLVLGHYSDFAIVSCLLLVNAVLAFIQERRSAEVVEELRQRLQVKARVLRDANWHVLAARDLVPGDIVRVRSGDIVPADMKVISGSLKADESALSGESREVGKSMDDLLSANSVIRRGEATCLVVLTGARTYFGRTTELVQIAHPKLHIETVVSKVVRWLFVIVGSFLSVVFVMSVIHGVSLIEMIPLMLVLLMGAVPVALPVMFTVSMAVGSRELAKKGVLVTRLSASEDVATMDVLCVDKTGTITMNQLAVTGVFPVGIVTEADVLIVGAMASQEADQDPIDLAFLAAAKSLHGIPDAKLISFVPFDAENRRTEAVFDINGQRLRVMKGAVRTVAKACGTLAKEIEALEARVQESALKGYRTLAVARGPEPGNLVLVGLVSLFDPPRPDAGRLISELKDLGILVKMLTGDALAVAQEIGQGIGLPHIRRAAELKSDRDRETDRVVNHLTDADGLAEVYPEDKYIFVQHLQKAGHVVGMTGDGVNDAPALRQAEVGIAVMNATDVAKGAASVVLTDKGLANIVSLVQQGRIIYQRVLTWIINKISRTILKSGFVAISYVVTGRFIITASEMLLITFITDFAKITIATDRVRPSRKPESWNIGGYITVAAVLGLLMIAETLLFLQFCWSRFNLASYPHEINQPVHTFSFLILLYFAVFSIISIRERHWFWSSMPGRSLIIALATDMVAGTILSFSGFLGLTPLPFGQIIAILFYAMASCLLVNDSVKVMLNKWITPSAVSSGA